MIVRTANGLPGNQNNIPPRLNVILLQTHDFAQASLNPIAPDSVPNAAIDSKAKSTIRKIVRQGAQDKEGIRVCTSLATNFLESLIGANSILSFHT